MMLIDEHRRQTLKALTALKKCKRLNALLVKEMRNNA